MARSRRNGSGSAYAMRHFVFKAVVCRSGSPTARGILHVVVRLLPIERSGVMEVGRILRGRDVTDTDRVALDVCTHRWWRSSTFGVASARRRSSRWHTRACRAAVFSCRGYNSRIIRRGTRSVVVVVSWSRRRHAHSRIDWFGLSSIDWILAQIVRDKHLASTFFSGVGFAFSLDRYRRHEVAVIILIRLGERRLRVRLSFALLERWLLRRSRSRRWRHRIAVPELKEVGFVCHAGNNALFGDRIRLQRQKSSRELLWKSF